MVRCLSILLILMIKFSLASESSSSDFPLIYSEQLSNLKGLVGSSWSDIEKLEHQMERIIDFLALGEEAEKSLVAFAKETIENLPENLDDLEQVKDVLIPAHLADEEDLVLAFQKAVKEQAIRCKKLSDQYKRIRLEFYDRKTLILAGWPVYSKFCPNKGDKHLATFDHWYPIWKREAIELIEGDDDLEFFEKEDGCFIIRPISDTRGILEEEGEVSPRIAVSKKKAGSIASQR